MEAPPQSADPPLVRLARRGNGYRTIGVIAALEVASTEEALNDPLHRPGGELYANGDPLKVRQEFFETSSSSVG